MQLRYRLLFILFWVVTVSSAQAVDIFTKSLTVLQDSEVESRLYLGIKKEHQMGEYLSFDFAGGAVVSLGSLEETKRCRPLVEHATLTLGKRDSSLKLGRFSPLNPLLDSDDTLLYSALFDGVELEKRLNTHHLYAGSLWAVIDEDTTQPTSRRHFEEPIYYLGDRVETKEAMFDFWLYKIEDQKILYLKAEQDYRFVGVGFELMYRHQKSNKGLVTGYKIWGAIEPMETNWELFVNINHLEPSSSYYGGGPYFGNGELIGVDDLGKDELIGGIRLSGEKLLGDIHWEMGCYKTNTMSSAELSLEKHIAKNIKASLVAAVLKDKEYSKQAKIQLSYSY